MSTEQISLEPLPVTGFELLFSPIYNPTLRARFYSDLPPEERERFRKIRTHNYLVSKRTMLIAKLAWEVHWELCKQALSPQDPLPPDFWPEMSNNRKYEIAQMVQKTETSLFEKGISPALMQLALDGECPSVAFVFTVVGAAEFHFHAKGEEFTR